MSCANDEYDTLIIGGGPAGLSAALNLVRARRRVLLVDTGRPRNAVTLIAHGFITRDGIPPHELRKLAREEIERYPDADVVVRGTVSAVRPSTGAGVGAGSGVGTGAGLGTGSGVGGFEADIASAGVVRVVRAASVVVATGLRETLPALPSIRAYYGMSLFSCAACDGYEQDGKPIALIGETPDLATRALLVAQWSGNLTVFTNGADVIDAADEAELASRGIALERRRIDDLEGDRGVLTGIRLHDDSVIPAAGGFVRPQWHPVLDAVTALALETDAAGLLVTDRDGRTSMPGVYAAGDAAVPGPQQLIVAAGAGARVAAVLNHDLLGVVTAH
ncbi:MAG: NAD(P)/FAD-dependent oxidoreductase [Microbacteriaceae bacterium]|nr:MAG: NAD(P)/FAD-dependent oxidoreductase [Microbacteriaceae bacterium]